MRLVIRILSALTVVASIHAATIHVPADQPTIQAGIDVASDGDTVLVAPGVYTETFTYNGKPITVMSATGPGGTTVIGSSINRPEHPTVFFDDGESSASVLEGFTFRGGPIAIRCSGSGPTIRRNVFTNQTYANWAALVIEGPAQIINNTICHGANGGIACYSSEAVIKNCIIAFNSNYGIAASGVSFLSLGYNDVYGQAQNYENTFNPGFPSISADPLFVNGALGNYLLSIGSPCIDAGDPWTIYNDPDGSRADMGAFSTSHHVPEVDSFSLGTENRLRVISHSPTIYWMYRDHSFSQMAFQVLVGPDQEPQIRKETWWSGVVSSADTSIIYGGPPLIDGITYRVIIAVNDGSEWDVSEPFTFRMNTLPPAPKPLRPLPGSLEGYRTTTIIAGKNPDPDGDTMSYDLELYRDANLTDVLYRQTGMSAIKDTISTGVLSGITPDTPYWWRVRSFDGYEYSLWSETILFSTRSVHSIHIPEDVPSIRGGIQLASTGDTLYVAPGQYRDVIEFGGKGIVVMSEAGRDSTLVFSSNTTVYALAGEDTTSVVDGFTLKGRVYCRRGSPIIQNCDIRPRTGLQAIYCDISSAKIRYNRVFKDSVLDEGVITIKGSVSDSPEISYNEIFSNVRFGLTPVTTPVRAIACQATTSAYIHHNVIHDHISPISGTCGVYVYGSGSSVRLVNNTITGNSSGIIVAGGAQPYVRNNIVAFNSGEGIPASLLNADYNCTFGNGSNGNPGPNGISVDPWFMNPETNDYHLPAVSPCVNAGDPDAAYIDPDGTRNDMGALVHRYVSPYAFNVSFGTDQQFHITSHTPAIFWTCRADQAIQREFEIEVGTDTNWATAEMWHEGPVLSKDTVIIYAGSELSDRTAYSVRVRVSDGISWGPWSVTASFLTKYKSDIHVPADFPTIQEGIDAGIDRDTVWVAPGVYTESIMINKRHLVVRSEQGPLQTIITNSEASDLVVFDQQADSLTVLEGFTLKGGRMGIWCRNACPTIVRNVLVGQGILNWAALSLGGKTFGSAGTSPAHITNNTIVGSSNGGLCNRSAVPPVIQNNIIASNRGYGMAIVDGYACILGYNDVWGNPTNYRDVTNTGVGSISADPLLDSLFVLGPGSPCINAGDPRSIFNDPDGTRNDIGAIVRSCCSGPTRGDINADGHIDLSDLSLLVQYLTGPVSPTPLTCPVAADLSGTGRVDLADLSALVSYFSGGGFLPPSCY